VNSDPFALSQSQSANAVVTTFKEVTGHVELMKYFKKSTAQLEEAQKVAQVGSWSFSLESQKIEWTRQMFEIFPESPSSGEPGYERHLSTIHPDDRAHWIKTVDHCVKTGEYYKMEFRTVHPNKTVWVEALGRGLKNTKGEVIALFGTCQDISEKKSLEEALNAERTRGMHASKLASLGEMAAGVAHEINNPLAIIAASVDLIPRLVNDSVTMNQKIDYIHKSITRISKIINGLRKFSRVTTERFFIKKNWVAIVEECLVLTAGKARKFDVQIQTELPEKCYIVCDEVEMEQVIVNLISNAADALSTKTGERLIRVRMMTKGDTAILQIQDNGPGVPVDKREKIFEPFFTTKKVGEGTGLGLSIAKGIITEHKGELSLEPSSEGALFQVTMKTAAE
jgi:signal transduction histidine kinase